MLRFGPKYLRFLYFYIFQNRFLQKYIFDFTIYKFVLLPAGRGRQGAYRPLQGGWPLAVPCRAVEAYM